MSKLRIKIDPKGKVTTTVEGAPGGACVEVDRPYRAGFAGVVVTDMPTAEANEPEIRATEHEQENQ